MKAKIIDIWDETHDVKTFRLIPEESMPFIPGQYLLLRIPEMPETRPFTFSNAPSERYIEVTVKRIHEFTTILHAKKPGDEVDIEGPFGEKLNFNESVVEDIVFIAGGSGITPFMSAIRYWKKRGLRNRIWLFYSNRSELDIIFKKELASFNVVIVHTLTEDVPSGWKGEKGRINEEMIVRYLDEPRHKLWFVCGPPPMVEAMRKILQTIGVPEQNWRIEDWQLPGKHDKEG